MRAVYLIIDKNNMMAKVGYTTDLCSRVYAYTTANPKAYIRDYCIIYAKSKTTLERAAAAELAKLGGRRLHSVIDGKRTEWHDFEDVPQVFENLLRDGLQALQCCKGRKSHGVYTQGRA